MCLGGKKRSLNVAARMNWDDYRLKQQISLNILKFWIHLENRPNDSIAQLCLNISKFGIVNHNLRIENGRFSIPKTPEHLRICSHCKLNSVEDKMHFLFQIIQ